ncbi:MAG: hypothetical protein KF861_21120, partial [Planctomycetaceae bacterium]|nr:hypothetical protein [Planctomycetaceae bacterium]
VIQAVTDAVALEIARDRRPSFGNEGRVDAGTGAPIPVVRATARQESWRATPDPAAFDRIEPADPHDPENVWPSIAQTVACELDDIIGDLEMPNEEPSMVPAAGALAADGSIPLHQFIDAGTSSGSGRERPYARLFSRARRRKSQP